MHERNCDALGNAKTVYTTNVFLKHVYIRIKSTRSKLLNKCFTLSTNDSCAQYYRPTNIAASRPHGKEVYEIAVSGDFGFGIESAIVNAITECNGELTRQLMEGEAHDNYFAAEFFVNAADLSCTIEELVKKIEKIPHVKQVHMKSREGYFYSHFLFPVMAFRRSRVIAFRADTLIRMQERLAQFLGSSAATILYEEGRSYGETITKNHKFLLRDAGEQLIIENLKEGSKATGWGVLDFEPTGDDRIRLSLGHPPLYNGEWIDTWLLYGAFAGILENVYDCKLSVERSEYDKEKDNLVVIYKLADR